jgi:hypothetical protein
MLFFFLCEPLFVSYYDAEKIHHQQNKQTNEQKRTRIIMLCPFKMLGLERATASEATVLKAWRRQMRRSHPDKCRNSDDDDSAAKSFNDAKDRALVSLRYYRPMRSSFCYDDDDIMAEVEANLKKKKMKKQAKEEEEEKKKKGEDEEKKKRRQREQQNAIDAAEWLQKAAEILKRQAKEEEEEIAIANAMEAAAARSEAKKKQQQQQPLPFSSKGMRASILSEQWVEERRRAFLVARPAISKKKWSKSGKKTCAWRERPAAP